MWVIGRPSLYLNIDDVIKNAVKKDIAIIDNLKEEIVKRLNAAGIRLLTKEELELTPGQPKMSMFPSFPTTKKVSPTGQVMLEEQTRCCTAGIWTSYTEGGTTLRHPLMNFNFGVWGEGHNTGDCSDLGNWFSGVFIQTIENFIAAKAKAEKEYAETNQKLVKQGKPALITPKVASPAGTGSMECNTSLMMYIEMFKTNKDTIMRTKLYILDKLADAIKTCSDYNYIIETHSDSRASAKYNKSLSKRRAHAIKHYLISRQVDEKRFEIKFFGESKPVTTGTTDEDHAANRRVVITPYKIK